MGLIYYAIDTTDKNNIFLIEIPSQKTFHTSAN